MKKLCLSLITAAALAAPGVASAQNATGTVNASATVLAFLEVSKVSDVDFGSVAAGAAASMTPGTAPGAGSLGVLEVEHNAEVSVAVALPAGGLSLVGGGGGEPKLPVSFTCGYSDAQSGALSGAPVDCSSLGNRLGNGDGSHRTSYVQVGGDIGSADTSDRIPGTYSGALVFTFTAIY